MKLSIIILTYNSSSYIHDCLSSIFTLYEKEIESKEFELILADNNSSDDTVRRISNFKFPVSSFRLIKNKENLGFAKGINRAVKDVVNGEYILLLNPDAQVQDKNITKIIKYMDNNGKVAVCGGKMIDKNGNDELSAGKFYSMMNVLYLALGIENMIGVRSSPSKIEKVDFVSGGFMMIRKDVFFELGGFDENIFMYVEDMEFCYRVKQKGYSVIFYPETAVRHMGQGSSNREFAIVNIYKGIDYFYKKTRK